MDRPWQAPPAGRLIRTPRHRHTATAQAAPGGASTTTNTINLSNASIPAGTPQSLFQSERWDAPDATEMSWAFPSLPDSMRCDFTSPSSTLERLPRARTFDVQIEGATLLDDYDVFAEVGANAGVVKNLPCSAIRH